jgi:hypothetical protein
LFPDVEKKAQCKGKKSLVVRAMCKTGLLGRRCRKENVCENSCKNPRFEKFGCQKRWTWAKKPQCKSDCYYKKFTGKEDCKFRRVCANGSVCAKKYKRYVNKCTKRITADTLKPAKKCAAHRYLVPVKHCGLHAQEKTNLNVPCWWEQTGHHIALRKGFQVNSIAIKLDATFPNSRPFITKKYQSVPCTEHDRKAKLCEGDHRNLELTGYKDPTKYPSQTPDECAIPFFVPHKKEKGGQWHWECANAGAFKWCSLDRVHDPKRSLWGKCHEKHLQYNVRPKVGCMTVKLNNQVVVQNDFMTQKKKSHGEIQGRCQVPFAAVGMY